MNVFVLGSFFQLLIFGWLTLTSVLKTKNTNILNARIHRVLWHNVNNLVNFIRHLKSINVLLAKQKPEQCSQQYSARHVFELINC